MTDQETLGGANLPLSEAPQILPASDWSAPLTTLVAGAMSFLAVLTLAASIAASKLADEWRADLAGVGIKAQDRETQLPLIAIMPRDKVEVVDTWRTLGLRATGSHDIKVDDVVVPRHWTFVRGSTPTMDDQVFRYPSMALASQVLAVVALGAARAALEYLHDTGNRQSVTGAPKPGARPYLQTEYAKARGLYLGARALFYDTLEEGYEELVHSPKVSRDMHIRLRLVATKAARDGAEAARMAFSLGGSTVLNEGHPLGRYMLDAAAVAQHAFLSEGTWTGAGAAMFDEPTMPGYP